MAVTATGFVVVATMTFFRRRGAHAACHDGEQVLDVHGEIRARRQWIRAIAAAMDHDQLPAVGKRALFRPVPRGVGDIDSMDQHNRLADKHSARCRHQQT